MATDYRLGPAVLQEAPALGLPVPEAVGHERGVAPAGGVPWLGEDVVEDERRLLEAVDVLGQGRPDVIGGARVERDPAQAPGPTRELGRRGTATRHRYDQGGRRGEGQGPGPPRRAGQDPPQLRDRQRRGDQERLDDVVLVRAGAAERQDAVGERDDQRQAEEPPAPVGDPPAPAPGRPGALDGRRQQERGEPEQPVEAVLERDPREDLGRLPDAHPAHGRRDDRVDPVRLAEVGVGRRHGGGAGQGQGQEQPPAPEADQGIEAGGEEGPGERLLERPAEEERDRGQRHGGGRAAVGGPDVGEQAPRHQRRAADVGADRQDPPGHEVRPEPGQHGQRGRGQAGDRPRGRAGGAADQEPVAGQAQRGEAERDEAAVEQDPAVGRAGQAERQRVAPIEEEIEAGQRVGVPVGPLVEGQAVLGLPDGVDRRALAPLGDVEAVGVQDRPQAGGEDGDVEQEREGAGEGQGGHRARGARRAAPAVVVAWSSKIPEPPSRRGAGRGVGRRGQLIRAARGKSSGPGAAAARGGGRGLSATAVDPPRAGAL